MIWLLFLYNVFQPMKNNFEGIEIKIKSRSQIKFLINKNWIGVKTKKQKKQKNKKDSVDTL